MAVIAVDIDDVLMPFFQSLADWHNERDGTNYHVDQLSSYRLGESWGMEEQYWIDQCNEFHSIGGSAAVDIDLRAKDVLSELAGDHEIVLVTSRPSMHREHTEAWMRRNLAGVTDRLIMCSDYKTDGGTFHMDKGQIAKDLDAIVLIDDAPHYVDSSKASGVEAILYGDYGWNRQADVGHLRANDWNEVQVLLNDILDLEQVNA